MDAALPPGEVDVVAAAVTGVCARDGLRLAELRTRESGRQRFAYATIRVPGDWTVQQSHETADEVEAAVSLALPGTTTFVHIEPAAG